jgi:TPR repeat protein
MAPPEVQHFRQVLLLCLLVLSAPVLSDTYSDALYAIRSRDYSQAYQLLRQLGNQGHVDAQYQLAAMYRAGTGTAKDHGKAAHWYRKAAEQGHAKAQYNLGVMYENGWGVTGSATEADHWYRLAADQGHRKARARLEGSLNETPDAGDKPVAAADLHRAVIKGDTTRVSNILDRGVPVNALDRSGATALIRAAGLGRLGRQGVEEGAREEVHVEVDDCHTCSWRSGPGAG